MADTVRQTTGGVVQRFNFALPGLPPVTSTTINQSSAPMPKDGLYSSYAGEVRGTSGTATAVHSIYLTDDPHSAGADDASTNPPTRNNFNLGITFGSTAATSSEGLFRPDMDGDEVYAVGVPVGTTMTYVSATSATLSATATATGPRIARFQQINNWNLAGTITLSGTKVDSGGFVTAAPWRWAKDVVTGITGTGATARCKQGV